MYKIWKYQKKLAYLERKFQSLQLNITEDNTPEIEDELSDEELEEEEEQEEEEEEEIENDDNEEDEVSSTASEFAATVPINHSSVDVVKSVSIPIKARLGSTSNRARLVASPESVDDPDISYETPLGSPDRSFQLEELKRSDKPSVTFQTNDNKCLELIIDESYESLKQISAQRQKVYENVHFLIC